MDLIFIFFPFSCTYLADFKKVYLAGNEYLFVAIEHSPADPPWTGRNSFILSHYLD